MKGIKCFGRNDFGQLGYGHTNDTGDEPDEMGDYLMTVDLGDTFIATKLAISGIFSWHTCAADSYYWKCWGRNQYGQLGYSYYGDVYDEMGEPVVVHEMGDYL